MVDTNSHSIKKKCFLAAYAETGNISEAAKISKVARSQHYYWLKNDESYPEIFEEARKDACDSLESEARRRAVEGWDEPVYQKGELVGHKRRYSDMLLMALLNANLPEKYGRHRVEHSGPNSGPIKQEALTNGMRVIEDGDWYGNAGRLANSASIVHRGICAGSARSYSRDVLRMLPKTHPHPQPAHNPERGAGDVGGKDAGDELHRKSQLRPAWEETPQLLVISLV